MRRCVTFVGALMAVFVAALPAGAQEQYPPYPPTPYPPTGADAGVAGTGGAAGGADLAFTGADLTLWASVAVALIALGLSILWLRRRQVARAS